MKDLALGIDIGTTSIKMILINKDGKIILTTDMRHDLISDKPGYAEEDPNLWWNNIISMLKKIVTSGYSQRIASVGVTGMVPTLILVDEEMNAIRNSIQQNDARSVDEIEYFRGIISEDKYFSETANTLNQQLIFPKYFWLAREEPQNVSKTRWIMGSYDYISMKLTGVPHTETNWALESGMWMIQDRKWDADILEKACIPEKILPVVFEPQEKIGFTNSELERQTGFPEGVPVIAGSADHIASSLAVGMNREGDLLLKFGGAGDIMYVTNSLKTDPRLFVDYHDIPGMFVINGCMASSGSLLKWYMNLIQVYDYEHLRDMAEKSGVGSQGIVLLPYFLGEKTPIFNAKARGTIIGLDLHHGQGDIYRAIMESVAFGFRHHIEVLKECGLKPKRVFISDGGAKDPLWRSIAADVIGADLLYITDNPGSSLGAAFIAGISVGLFTEWEEIEKFLSQSTIVKADMDNSSLYDTYYRVYRRLYEALVPLYEELYEIKENN